MSTNAQDERDRRRPISAEADLEEQMGRTINAILEAGGKVEPPDEIDRLKAELTAARIELAVSGVAIADERDEVARLTAERDAYYRTATERHFELVRLRAAADGLAEACQRLMDVIPLGVILDSDTAEEAVDAADAALVAYDAVAGTARAAEGEGGRDAS